jgi:hypothetical protein
MGELSDKEMRKVECMSLVHEEITKELRSIEESFEMMAMDTAIKPSDALKDRIWQDIEASKEKPTTPVVKMKSQQEEVKAVAGFNWARAASIAAIIGLTALTWTNYSSNKELTAQLDSQKEAQKIQDQKLAESGLKLEQVTADLNIVASPDFTEVRMDGTANAPTSIAQVYWNAKNNDVYLRVEDMAPLPDGKIYQLWALDGGIPVDAGTFSPNYQRLVKMKSITSGQAFAVTIEDAGGAESPALETLQVIGNVPV